ncbi:MAG: RimK family alpha-L-glutamate ligase [Candidatus Bathyarchaeia archaeon]
MKVLVIYGSKPSANSLELVQKSLEHGHDVADGSLSKLSSEVSMDGSRFWLEGEEVTDIDLCLLRSFGPGSNEQLTRRISMVEHLEMSGVRVVNPCYPFRRARDKYATQYILQKGGLPVATTYTTEDPFMASMYSEEFGVSVYKPILGSMGKGSLKFDEKSSAEEALIRLSDLDLPLIVQKFIQNPGRDVRVLIVGNEIIGSVYRYAAKGSWKANVAQGGEMQQEEIPEEFKEIALKATKTMELDYCGVDILEGPDGPVILEVNASPGWQGFKEATGINVAEKIVTHAENLAKK